MINLKIMKFFLLKFLTLKIKSNIQKKTKPLSKIFFIEKMLKSKLFLGVLLLALMKRIDCVKPNTTEAYQNSLTLISPDSLYLYWKHDKETITFELHLKNTSAWASFGVENDKQQSDFVVAGLSVYGIGYFADYAFVDGKAKTDTVHNWFLLDAFNSDEFTVFKFNRNIKLVCDGNTEDLDILSGANRVIFSTGNTENVIEKNGTQSVTFLTESLGPFNCVKTQKPTFTSSPTGVYSFFEDLVEDGAYRLYWNYTKTDFIGEIHVRTLGWVGFGLSPTGGMDKSDVVIGWISNGVANFTDRFINGQTKPVIDKNQDWKLLSSAESNGYTIFKFQRPIKLCDADDRTIEEGTPRVIFAWGKSDPAPGQDISYHESNRLSKGISLISYQSRSSNQVPADSEEIDFVVQNVIKLKLVRLSIK